MSLQTIQRGIDEGLVLHVPFTEGSGTTVYDRSPSDAEIIFSAGAAAPSWSTLTGMPVVVIADEESLQLTDITKAVLTTECTISCWVYPTTIDHSHRIADKLIFGAKTGYQLGFNSSGNVVFTLGDGITNYNLTADIDLVVDTLYLISATWDGAIMKAYVNGIQDPTTLAFVNTISDPATELIIGSEGVGGNESLNGSMYGLRIYDRAISPQEIRYLSSMRRRL